jgi:methionine synthase II (cobalamin-independent)
MSTEDDIHSETTLEEIVINYPELIKPLMEFGIKCVACGEPIWGSLAENAEKKGIENLDQIIERLNEIIQK